MDSQFNEKVKDIKFISAETLSMDRDCLLLRIPVLGAGVRADAIVRLDVACYVHPDDGTDLLEIMYDSGRLPTTLEEVRKGWPIPGDLE